jgi:hypothetical protein
VQAFKAELVKLSIRVTQVGHHRVDKTHQEDEDENDDSDRHASEIRIDATSADISVERGRGRKALQLALLGRSPTALLSEVRQLGWFVQADKGRRGAGPEEQIPPDEALADTAS